MVVAESRSHTKTVAHEMEHSLGLKHKHKGLMTPASNDPNRSNEINQKDINDIIENAKDRKRNDGQGVGHYYKLDNC
jgi:hypothetical protein